MSTATDQKPQTSLKGYITQHHVHIQTMRSWVNIPFNDFCGFWSVSVRIMDKLHFFVFCLLAADTLVSKYTTTADTVHLLMTSLIFTGIAVVSYTTVVTEKQFYYTGTLGVQKARSKVIAHLHVFSAKLG